MWNFCFWYNYGLIVWLVSALETRRGYSLNTFYEKEAKTNIEVLQNSYLLLFDVNTMLTISVIIE